MKCEYVEQKTKIGGNDEVSAHCVVTDDAGQVVARVGDATAQDQSTWTVDFVRPVTKAEVDAVFKALTE